MNSLLQISMFSSPLSQATVCFSSWYPSCLSNKLQFYTWSPKGRHSRFPITCGLHRLLNKFANSASLWICFHVVSMSSLLTHTHKREVTSKQQICHRKAILQWFRFYVLIMLKSQFQDSVYCVSNNE